MAFLSLLGCCWNFRILQLSRGQSPIHVQTSKHASIPSHPFGFFFPTRAALWKYFKNKKRRKPTKNENRAQNPVVLFFVFTFITEFSLGYTWSETQVQWTLSYPLTSFCSYWLLPIFFMYNMLPLILLAFPWGYSILETLHFYPSIYCDHCI